MTSNRVISSLLLPVLILLAPTASVAITCSSGSAYSTMVTCAFVDIFDTGVENTPVAPTADGGAVLATLNTNSGDIRVVRVNSDCAFEWVSEPRLASGDSPSYLYHPKAITVSTAESGGPFVYVAGYVRVSGMALGYVAKLKLSDGSQISSATCMSTESPVFTILSDSTGTVVLAGYINSGGIYQLLATVSTSTLAITQKSFSTSCSGERRVFKVVEDSALYVFAGTCSSSRYLWVLAVLKSGWAKKWECFASTTISYNEDLQMQVLSSGTYTLIYSQIYYEVTSTSSSCTIAKEVATSGALTVVPAPISSTTVMLLGYGSDSSSFAYYYDTAANCRYDTGQIAHHSGARFWSSSQLSAAANRVWVGGYYYSLSPYIPFIALVQQVAPVSCSGQTNYFNSACYTAGSSSCFGLCPTCLLSSDINACATIDSSKSHQGAISLFAGRCSTSGQHYNAATATCESVTTSSASCYDLCGGECLSSSSVKCAHHCKGKSLEPYIDTSKLWLNVCRCKLGATYNTGTSSCQLVTPCHALCGTGGCGVASDNTQCVDCASGATAFAVSGSEYVACCSAGTAFSGSACQACSMFCNGCSVPADSTGCNDCASIVNVAKTGSSAPYTCGCVSGTGYDSGSGMCVYTTLCYPLCQGGKCTAQSSSAACLSCDSTASSSLTSGTTNIYTCTCGAGTIYDGSKCATILSSGCYPLCQGGTCTAANDPTACLSCVASATSGVTSGKTNIYTCVCGSGTIYDGSMCETIISSGCHPLCLGGTCITVNDPSACLSCDASAVSAVTSGKINIYTCTCGTGTIYDGTNCKTIITTGCYPLCLGGTCIVANDPASCLSCIASATSAATTGKINIQTCTCGSGTIYDGTTCPTILTAGCYPLCQGGTCVLANDPAACLACIAASTSSGTAGKINILTCTCGTGTVYDGSTCQTILTTGCYPLCQGGTCVTANDPTACLSCVSSATSSATTGLANIDTCSCGAGTLYDGTVCLTILTTGCSLLCNSGCIQLANQLECVDCAAGASKNVVAGQPYFACCAAGTAYTGGVCSPCHVLCATCSVAADNAHCGTCVNITNVELDGTTCSCVAGTSYDVATELCVYTTNCHPLCDSSKCTAQNSAAACVSSCEPSSTATMTSTPYVYSCTCPPGTVYNGTVCPEILHSTCYPLCGAAGCTEAGDQTKCLDCVTGRLNVRASSVNLYYSNCSCTSGTVLTPSGLCVYQDGCSVYCETCLAQDNSSACVGCVVGIVPADVDIYGETTCECPNGTVYYSESCATVLTISCSPMCNGTAGCIAENDSTKCLSSCSLKANSVILSQTGSAVNCGCGNGTRLNSAGRKCVLDLECDPLCDDCSDEQTCLSCPSGGEGMVLSAGKCICATTEGYVLSGTKCVKDSTTATNALKYTGYLCLCIDIL